MSGFIFDKMLQWIYLAVYSAVAEFFELMGNMGADMFGLEWVKAFRVVLVRCGNGCRRV